jgi:hypothetical protein
VSKDKRIVQRPEKDWVIVENTHEPLVDQATFDTVQERIKIKQPATWANSTNIYRGLLICGGCGTRMVFSSRTGRKSKGHFSCNKHRRYGGTECSDHYITVEQVRELLLEDIRRHAGLAAADKERYAAYLMELSEQGWNGEKASYQKEADACRGRLAELDVVLKRLYEDNVFGKISDERYASMSADYEAEAKKRKERYDQLQDQLTGFQKKGRDAKAFAALVEQYTDLTDVTEELLHTLIDKVVVHEKEVVDGEIIMRVDIYYRFIGKVPGADGEDLKALPIRRNTKLLQETDLLSA